MAVKIQRPITNYLPQDDIEDGSDGPGVPLHQKLGRGHQIQLQYAYVEPEQQQMLDALQSYDYLKLTDEIGRIEPLKAPSFQVSRLRGEAWQIRSVHLLAQRHPEVLKSVLDNTLPQRAKIDLGNVIREPARAMFSGKGELDAVIYINYIADKEGKGLTRENFKFFLAAMKCAAGRCQDDPGRFVVDGVNLENGINLKFSNCRKGAVQSFYKHVGKDKLATLEERTDKFVDINTGMLRRAKDADIDHVMLKGEVGWTVSCYDRCREHRQMTKSPEVFQLARLVAQHLFPDQDFKLHQFVLFDVVQEEEASVGESIGSQMAAAYESYGGFNVDQAGKSVNGVWDVTSGAWMDRRTEIAETELQYVDENLVAMIDLYSDREASVREKQRVLRLITELQDSELELGIAKSTWQRRFDHLQLQCQQAVAEVDVYEEAIQTRASELAELTEAEDAIRDLHGELATLKRELGCD